MARILELSAICIADLQARARARARTRKAMNATIPKPAVPKRLSEGEETLALQLDKAGICGWTREFRFAHPRKWRADFAFPEDRLLVEVEGGIWQQGRHQTGTGFQADMEKYNAATMLNYAVLRFSTQQVKQGVALAAIKKYLGE